MNADLTISDQSIRDAAYLDQNTDWYHYGKPAMILTAATGAAAVALPIIFGALSLAGKLSLTATSWPLIGYFALLGTSTLWFGPRVFKDAYNIFFKVLWGHVVSLKKVEVDANGGWTPKDADYQGCYFDSKPCNQALAKFVQQEKITRVVDFGCGNASFLKAIKNANWDVQVKGYDGNPNTATISGGIGETADITDSTLDAGEADLVMCIETAEHVPSGEKTDALVQNLVKTSTQFILIGWAIKGQGGHGHINEQNNDWVIEKFRQNGFQPLLKKTVEIRKEAGDPAVFWNQNLILFGKE